MIVNATAPRKLSCVHRVRKMTLTAEDEDDEQLLALLNRMFFRGTLGEVLRASLDTPADTAASE